MFNLALGLEVLEGAANGRVGEADGDGAEGAGVELWVSLHDIERAPRGEGVVVVVHAGNDLAFLGVRVGGDGKMWAFGGGVDGFGGRCTGERNGGWIDEGDGGGGELCVDGIFRGSGRDVIDGGVGFSGRRHVAVGWKCCCWR